MTDEFLAKLAVWYELRAETRYFVAASDKWMINLFVLIAILVGISYLDRLLDPKFRNAIVLASFIGAIMPGLLAREDLLIHRPAPGVAALENEMGIHGWENYFKPKVKPLTNLLPALDALVAIPVVFLFWYATREAAAYLDYFWFAPLMWLIHIVGWGMLVYVLKLGSRLM